ncbi:MAG: FumA C-terminus/TtdB family hydratase beta subunit [Nitrospirota bacterium]|nr:FumA C-terminus/TtdB family hydratase beta subunit [Nitrospirota bacterium]
MDLKRLTTPLSEEDTGSLRVGDFVMLNGMLVTGRDRVHKFLFSEKLDSKSIPFELKGAVLYHCGPIIKKEEQGYRLIAGGPTTSQRVEMYEWWVIKEYGLKGIIGKGGMGEKTLQALREEGCVYLHTISGAAVYLADRIKRVVDGWKIEEFGEPEAMWLIEVEDFPAIVTMDAHGNSLHKTITENSMKVYKELIL